MQALAEDKDKGKAAVKEKFTRFFDLLDEIAERHKFAKVLAEDEEVRETITEEVVKLVVPVFQRFTQRNTGKDFSKSAYSSYCVLYSNKFHRSNEVSAPLSPVDHSIQLILFTDIKMSATELESQLRGFYT